jgi:hypothetical protein
MGQMGFYDLDKRLAISAKGDPLELIKATRNDPPAGVIPGRRRSQGGTATAAGRRNGTNLQKRLS